MKHQFFDDVLLMLRVLGLWISTKPQFDTNIGKLQYVIGSRYNNPTILTWLESYKILKILSLIIHNLFLVLMKRNHRIVWRSMAIKD